ncbi:MAG: AAA family ATPase, partial [Solirubrobacteraceae bacterium]
SDPGEVLCEGEDSAGVRKDFDARCYRTIFATEFPDTEFLAVGNDQQVQSDLHGIGAVEVLAPGTVVERVIDRDDRSDAEVAEAAALGTRVLGRRHLEAYLLDDEVLERLCISVGKPAQGAALKAAKQAALTSSVGPPRGNPPDDLISCAGEVFTAAKRLLELVAVGNNKDTFMRDTLAPLLVPGMSVYGELKAAMFGT